VAFYCIGDEDTVRGLRLAGVEGRTACTPSEAMDSFAWATARQDCELLIITGEVAAQLGAVLEAFRMDPQAPLVVEIPGPGGPMEVAGGLHSLVRSAVGLSLERVP